ncbi:MAG: FGGY family carbohydrate kinase, partial [Clostridia bacterium]
MSKYSIGVDYGTQSGRAVLVDVSNGDIICDSVKPYTHCVIDEQLPTGEKLGSDWALQHPRDYLEVLETTIPDVMKRGGVDKNDVIGMSIDFTACTILPIDKDGEPLCFKEEFVHNPHAYVKLWKHHAAQYEANKLNETAAKMGETFLKRYGGKISSEWLVPKVMQLVDEAEDVYDACDCILEATDWVTYQLSGKLLRNSCTAGYKALWS